LSRGKPFVPWLPVKPALEAGFTPSPACFLFPDQPFPNLPACILPSHLKPERRRYSMKKSLQWIKPAFKEMRYGFEINLYIMNR
jgi:coenzyme PQQ precursor peptide PqqA